MQVNKTTSLIVFGIIVLIGIILIIRGNGKEEVTPTDENMATESEMTDESTGGHELTQGEYAITSNSTVAWEGTKPLLPNYVDRGTLTLTEGTLSIDVGGMLIAGTAVADMNTIVVTETGVNGGFNGLARDLVSDRFFDVANHPTATFTLTSISEMNRKGEATVTGDITIKGITKSIEFPVIVTQKDATTITLDAEASIDRTEFGITFGSGKFFSDLGDKIIDDMVPLNIHIEAVTNQ